MAESALALREHPQIIELLSVLEQNSLSKQKEEVQALVGYIDGMEEKLSQMMDEMKAMRLEVEKLHDKGIRALAGKEALEAQKLEADKGALARLRGLFTSCGKTFAQMERGAGRLAEKTGGEKSSVKTELRGLKPAPEGQRRQAANKEQAR